MNRCDYACQTRDHLLSRRAFIGSAAAGVMGLSALTTRAANQELAKHGKRVMVIFLGGGVSQLESWDPKPNTDTGGPFRAIPTSVPGIHISELLPYTAQQMHRLSLVRGINTKEDEHGRGATIMMTASTTVLTSAAVMTAAVTAHEPFQETHHFSFVDGSSLRPRGVGCCDDLRCDASANACSK